MMYAFLALISVRVMLMKMMSTIIQPLHRRDDDSISTTELENKFLRQTDGTRVVWTLGQ